MEIARKSVADELPPERQSGAAGGNLLRVALARILNLDDGQPKEPRSLTILAVLAIGYTIFFASSFLLPIFMALLFALLLHPFVEFLRHYHVPEWIGAAVVISTLAALIALVGLVLHNPVESWINRAPQLLPEIERKLSDVRESVEKAEKVSEEIEKVTTNSTTNTTTVAVGPSLAQRIVGGTRSLLVVILATVVLLYFLLARGRQTVTRILASIDDLDRRRRWRIILGRTQRELGHYLLTVTVINISLAAVTTFVLTMLGVPDALLWGVLAGLLNFMPYVGSLIMIATLTVISLSTFDGWLNIILPPLIFFLLTALEGQFLTPAIVGKRLTLNPIALFVSVLFWGWVWGMPGALLAVPILAMLRVMATHIAALAFLRPVLQ